MKLNIVLVTAAFLILEVGFNADFIGSDKIIRCSIYDFCDSMAWTIFTLFAYRLARSIKEDGVDKSYQKSVKILKLVCEIFMVLSISPLVNEVLGIAQMHLLSNYVFGGGVILFYLTLAIVKKYRNART